MPIFEATSSSLHQVIQNASQGVYLIPDIQRQYVWTPDKIIMLIDSMLKGWPFSNLLLWDVGDINNVDNLVPHRPFKRILARVDDQSEQLFPGANVPNHITMILDGQQRIQSLLLAFGAEDAGLILLDKDWYSSFSDDRGHPYRGMHVNQRYCLGKLYIDTNELISDENIVASKFDGYNLRRSVDWTKIFKWAIPAKQDIGGVLRPDNYKWPIDRLGDGNVQSSRIRASGLWEAAAGFNHADEEEKELRIEALSRNINFSNNLDEVKLYRALLGLLKLIGGLREQQIPCLKLLSIIEAGYVNAPEEYSEAIVNIFNRLNAAGTPLKEDEICSAWIRNKWEQLAHANQQQNNNIQANKIYDEVRGSFAYLSLDDKDVVAILNIVWAAYGAENDLDARIFTRSDLLRGNVINSMTEWFFYNIAKVKKSIAITSEILEKSGLKFNYHFKSKNSIFALILFIFGKHEEYARAMIAPENQAFMDKDRMFLTKWILISLFGGRWARNSDADIKQLVHQARNQGKNNINLVFLGFIEANREECIRHIKEYSHGDQYHRARLIFFAWYFSKGNIDYLVNINNFSLDHLVSKSVWMARVRVLMNNNIEIINVIHEIGNLNELGRCDNSSKNDNSLHSWLQHNNEARNTIRANHLEYLKNTFSIPDEISNPIINNANDIDIIIKVIQNRTAIIKKDILHGLGLNNQD